MLDALSTDKVPLPISDRAPIEAPLLLKIIDAIEVPSIFVDSDRED